MIGREAGPWPCHPVLAVAVAACVAGLACAGASRPPGPATPAELGLDTRIEPGVRLGPVTATTSESRLASDLGQQSLASGPVYLAEGFCAPGTRLFPDTPGEIEISWADSARTRPAFARIRRPDAPWRTDTGIGIGTTLRQLEAIFGSVVEFSGFGWDYGGSTAWKEPGVENDPDSSIGLRLAPDTTGLRQLHEDPDAGSVWGEGMVRSDHPSIRRITVRVREIVQSWRRPVDERPCG